MNTPFKPSLADCSPESQEEPHMEDPQALPQRLEGFAESIFCFGEQGTYNRGNLACSSSEISYLKPCTCFYLWDDKDACEMNILQSLTNYPSDVKK